MKWLKLIEYDKPLYFSGIYKIVQYKHLLGSYVKPYYQPYYIGERDQNWGVYVDRGAQKDKPLTLRQAQKLCVEHAKHYAPSAHQIMVSERSINKHREIAA